MYFDRILLWIAIFGAVGAAQQIEQDNRYGSIRASFLSNIATAFNKTENHDDPSEVGQHSGMKTEDSKNGEHSSLNNTITHIDELADGRAGTKYVGIIEELDDMKRQGSEAPPAPAPPAETAAPPAATAAPPAPGETPAPGVPGEPGGTAPGGPGAAPPPRPIVIERKSHNYFFIVALPSFVVMLILLGLLMYFLRPNGCCCRLIMTERVYKPPNRAAQAVDAPTQPVQEKKK